MNDNDAPDVTFLLGQIVADIKNMNRKLDEIRTDIKEDIKKHDSKLSSIEDRLTKIEIWKKNAVAITAAFSLMLSVFWAVAGPYVQNQMFTQNEAHSVK